MNKHHTDNVPSRRRTSRSPWVVGYIIALSSSYPPILDARKVHVKALART